MPERTLEEMRAAYETLEKRISAACEQSNRPRESVKLIWVSKFHPIESVKIAEELGATDFGENRVQEAVEKFKNLLVENGSTVWNEEEWGLKKLAYPIQKKSTGFYALLQFDAEPTIVNTLETAFRRDERVLRFLTFRLDKYAYEYAQKRLHGGAKKENNNVEPTEAEAPAEAPAEKTEE